MNTYMIPKGTSVWPTQYVNPEGTKIWNIIRKSDRSYTTVEDWYFTKKELFSDWDQPNLTVELPNMRQKIPTRDGQVWNAFSVNWRFVVQVVNEAL